MRLQVDQASKEDSAVPDRARAGRVQVCLPQVRVRYRSAATHSLETVAMKWVDDLKASAAAFVDWERLLTIVGFIIAGLLVMIAVELFVIYLKI